MAVGNYKNYSEMEIFWSSLPAKVKTILYRPARILVLDSDEVPLYPLTPSRIRALPKYLLFSDIFVVIQGTLLIEYPLDWVWLDHLHVSETVQQQSVSAQMSNFRLILPETVIDLQCKEFAHKSMWVSCIVEAIGLNLNIPQFVNSRGDLTLDTQLQLIRGREFIDYAFQTNLEMKDGKYKGPWMNAKPHGIGEYWHEPSGKLYKGCFKKGLFHGRGELLWFTDKEDKKKYIGEFVKGKMNGKGEMKYSNGDVYDGSWDDGRRTGFGTLEVASRKNSKYTGGWRDDKRNGYGVYDDKMRHERYLGMWIDNQRFGPGILITSTGTYCEATFSDGMLGNSGNDGLILDPDGSSFMGKIGSGLRLAGKGMLTLTNGSIIDGVFAGSWHGSNIEIQRGILTSQKSGSMNGSRSRSRSGSCSYKRCDLQIARLDRRVGTCTVLASNKWLPVYEECEKLLGFSGNAATDVITAWSRIASGTFDSRRNNNNSGSSDKYFLNPVRRTSSLNVIPKSVRTPVELITLERARAQTVYGEFREEDEYSSVEEKGEGLEEGSDEDRGRVSYLKNSSLDELEKSLLQMSIEHSIRITKNNNTKKVEISGPLHLQEDVACSYPPATVNSSWIESMPSPARTTLSESDSIDGEEIARQQQQASVARQQDSKFDATAAIQKYIDKAFNTHSHPLGILMNRLEDVFRDSYAGIGANRFLLSHAIAEVHYIIKRLHSIIRILFPFLDGDDHDLTNIGFHRMGVADPEDYLSIGSGYHLLHPLVFMRIFPTLIMLYILHHVDEDRRYQTGVDCLAQMDLEHLVHFIRLPLDVLSSSSPESSGSVSIIKCLDRAAKILHKVNTLYTPGEFLDLFKSAFKQLHSIDNISGDLLLPSVVYIIINAKLQHLGAYLHFLTDFANTKAEDDYILVTYEAAYNFIQRQDSLTL